MLDFPSPPVDDQIFVAPNGVTYKYQTPPGIWTTAGKEEVISSGGYVRAEWYGDTRDEITLNAAMADAKAKGVNVLVGEGTWTTTPDGVFINPGVELIGSGPNVTHFVKIGTGPCFRAAGPKPVLGRVHPTNVATAVAAGALTLTMEPGEAAKFAVGDKCVLVSSDPNIRTDPIPSPDTDASNSGFKGEFVSIRLLDPDGLTLHLWGPTKLSYTNGGGPELAKYLPLAGVAFRNFSILMDETIDPLLNSNDQFRDHFGIDCRYLQSPVIENVHCSHMVQASFFFTVCSGAKVLTCRSTDGGSSTASTSLPDSSEGVGGFAYSVREDSLNEGLIVEGLVSERCRAAYDSNIGYTSVWPYGGQFDTVVSHCVAIDSKEGAFATHINSQGVRFLNCGVIGGRLGGFQLRSRGCLVENCFAQRTVGPGVWVRGAGGGGPFISPTPPNPPHDMSQSAIGFWGDDCVIRNFHALETNLGIGAAIPTVNWIDRGAVHIDAWNCTVDGLTVVRSGGSAVSIGSDYYDDAMGTTVKNVVAHDVCQLTTTRKYVIDIHNAEPADLITIDGVTSYSSDNKVEHVVYRRAGANDALLKLVNIGGYGHTSKVIGVEDHDTGISVFGNTTGPSYLSRRYTASLYEDFLGFALLPIWKTTLVGSDPQCVAPSLVTTTPVGGKCRLVSGDTGGSAAGGSASVLLDGCSLVSALNWRTDLGITAEFKVLTGSLALTSYFIGFTDNITTLSLPWTVTGGTYTSNQVNGVGFLFDTAATASGEWHLVGVNTNVDATPQLTGVAPSSSVYQRLRVDISTTGIATFMINGRVVGTGPMTGAVGVSVSLSPIVSVLSRTTAIKVIDVDYIHIEQTGIV